MACGQRRKRTLAEDGHCGQPVQIPGRSESLRLGSAAPNHRHPIPSKYTVGGQYSHALEPRLSNQQAVKRIAVVER
jgi:hypothetical protein